MPEQVFGETTLPVVALDSKRQFRQTSFKSTFNRAGIVLVWSCQKKVYLRAFRTRDCINMLDQIVGFNLFICCEEELSGQKNPRLRNLNYACEYQKLTGALTSNEYAEFAKNFRTTS